MLEGSTSDRPNSQRKLCCTSEHTSPNNNGFTVQTVKHVFNTTAILIHNTLQVTLPFADPRISCVTPCVSWIRMADILKACFTVCRPL